jgi:hydroxylamine dehydrogenase
MKYLAKSRLLITSLLLTAFVLLGASVTLAYTGERAVVVAEGGDLPTSNTVLASTINQGTDECVVCHTDQTPGIANQHLSGQHFANGVTCSNCHEVDADYPGAVEHPEADFWVLPESTTAQCEECHSSQVQQFELSRHALPAYVAYAGTDGLSEEHSELYLSIPERGGIDARGRNSLHAMEGEAITRFACETCHDIGKPAEDGSVGDCTTCHLRHEFSLEQARKPETCNACHIGPDHPQWEIYQESAHGIAYMTGGDDWNWDAEPGTLTTLDMPAATCATCHMSGFGLSATTHDVGDRLTMYLAAPISQDRPSAAENRVRMQNVCKACHSDTWVEDFYDDAYAATEVVNEWVMMSDYMVQPLKDNGLMTAAPFDEPIDYLYFNIWHHWGRTAKFGVWMQGADYVQWHGAYEIMHDLSELREIVDERLEEAGLEPLELPESFPSAAAAAEIAAIMEAGG